MANLPRKTVLLNIIATAWLAAAVAFAGVFVIVEHDHAHVDVNGHHVPNSDNCRICIEIQIAIRIIEAFGRLGVFIAIMGVVFYSLSFEKPQQFFYPLNPIMLKVKFNC
ncbi:hypothetical protein R84B8_01048 [Treponema sp. R8-4-B8]